ncbi:tRNA (guanine(37)-N(1))-methyltransferase isoform X1 [Manis javanica]|uniref:tRNA (guanine(37)-N(1))-methyltransferase isoform X1 n=2 Tax=Manis javanica TaxID=9974 RepID=UPI0008137BB8|nr:tRNA (guanine(37)-N1)-methyltransferase isoform X1 [Manis javanica]KAI5946294.1 tRNA (guanine(37)-N1)-methyltransferase [Manis javanica]
MRIFRRPFGFSRRLLKVESCRITESESLIPLAWTSLIQKLSRAPIIFLLDQRKRFSTMPEIETNQRDSELFSPPSNVRGMTKLDRTAFKKKVTIPVLKVRKEIVSKLMRSLKRAALQRPGIKRVIEDPEDEGSRLIMLDPYKMISDDSFEKAELSILKQLNVNSHIAEYNLELTYENFKSEEILRAVLPEGQDVTSGFSRVGHIAHLNLRDHQLPFKHLIGQVMIDKNPGITSAVNKTSNIDSTFRNFQMEVLSGEENMTTKVRENSYTYEFDFSKVYWNPRLSTEHSRITELLKPGDVLFDVFAGVGPFAIPVAKKNCTVFANDLNPESHKWLSHNCKLNKVDQKVKVFNLDGKDFLQGPVREELMQQLGPLSQEKKHSVHIVMNLPAKAVEFLSALKSLLDGPPCSNEFLPIVHCYSFSKDANPAKDVQQRAGAVLGISLEACSSVHLVRNVAPNKEMLCITFQIPAAILYKNQTLNLENNEAPPLKRQKMGKAFSEEKTQIYSVT